MNGPAGRFDPSELVGGNGPAPAATELADAFAAARTLEAHASADRIGPTSGFEDRVMAVIATEPAPRVVVRSGSAIRGRRPAAFLVAIRDAWATLTGPGRPVAVRAQAFGLLALVGLVIGSLGGVAAVGVGNLVAPQNGPAESVQSLPTATASPDLHSTPSPSPSIELSPKPTETQAPNESTEPTASPQSSERPEITNSPSPTESSGATDTPKPEDTPKPGETLKPGETPRPGGTAEPSDDHGGGSSGGG